MGTVQDKRETDKVALMGYIETCVMREIDELADLGSYDELWRLWEYLWDRVPARPTSNVTIAPDTNAYRW